MLRSLASLRLRVRVRTTKLLLQTPEPALAAMPARLTCSPALRALLYQVLCFVSSSAAPCSNAANSCACGKLALVSYQDASLVRHTLATFFPFAFIICCIAGQARR